jgi:hypothetical protein
MPRQLVVVDVETTGLADDAVILEVAAVNVTTGDEFYFAPHVSQEELVAADMEAMAINRYYERRVWSARKNPHDTEIWYGRLRSATRSAGLTHASTLGLWRRKPVRCGITGSLTWPPTPPRHCPSPRTRWSASVTSAPD